MKTISTLSFALLALLLSYNLAYARGRKATLDFNEQYFDITGNADFVSAVDFNGDGLLDLYVMQDRRMHIYYQHENAQYSNVPDETFFLGRQAIMVDLEDINQNGKTDIVVASPRGTYYLEHNGTKISKTIHVLSKKRLRLNPPTSGAFPWVDFVSDFNDDGYLDFWLPTQDTLTFYYGDSEQSYRDSQEFELPTDTTWTLQTQPSILQSAIQYRFVFGGVDFIDFNADAKKDFMYLLDRQLIVYPQDADGHFDEAEKMIFPLPKVNHGIIWPLAPCFFDINHDGYIDLAQADGGEGTVKIYLGSANLDCYSHPKQIIREKGWIYRCDLIDLDGDGFRDLYTMQTSKVTWGKAVKVFLKKETTVYVQVYRNRAMKNDGKLFSTSHDYIESLNNPMAFKVGYTGVVDTTSRIFVSAWHDFNNDGKRDIFALTDDTQFSLYMGERGKEMYPKRPTFNYTIQDCETYTNVDEKVLDLNGDGFLDIILIYKNNTGANDKLGIFLSEH